MLYFCGRWAPILKSCLPQAVICNPSLPNIHGPTLTGLNILPNDGCLPLGTLSRSKRDSVWCFHIPCLPILRRRHHLSPKAMRKQENRLLHETAVFFINEVTMSLILRNEDRPTSRARPGVEGDRPWEDLSRWTSGWDVTNLTAWPPP